MALYLIEILHQTTTIDFINARDRGCILSKFYIKPQLLTLSMLGIVVVSYRNSTSNHNSGGSPVAPGGVVSYRNSTSNHNISQNPSSPKSVVSYRNSTSNHNCRAHVRQCQLVVSYRNSTSNHNVVGAGIIRGGVVSYRNSTSNHNSCLCISEETALYLIEILHQTTTVLCVCIAIIGCILSKFYIKPQPSEHQTESFNGCILSKFYIKPQRRASY